MGAVVADDIGARLHVRVSVPHDGGNALGGQRVRSVPPELGNGVRVGKDHVPLAVGSLALHREEGVTLPSGGCLTRHDN